MGESLGYLLILIALAGGVGVGTYVRVRARDRAEDELVERVTRRVRELDAGEDPPDLPPVHARGGTHRR